MTVHCKGDCRWRTAVFAVTAMLGILGGVDAEEASGSVTADPIEGVWLSTITIRDCRTGAAIGTAVSQSHFESGGKLTETPAEPGRRRGPGLGQWQRAPSGNPEYRATHQYVEYDPETGEAIGARTVWRNIKLAPGLEKLSATVAFEVRDLQDRVTASSCATEAGIRRR